MDIVTFRNVGSTPVEFNGNQRVAIAPGASKVVPWEFACAWFGNPELRQEERALRYNLARLQWGYEDGLDTPASWAAKRPAIEVYDTEGRRVWMLIEDEHGEHPFSALGSVDLAASAESDDSTVLRAALAKMQAEMAALNTRLASITPPTPDLAAADITALSTTDDGGQGTQLPAAVTTTTTTDNAPAPARRVR